MESSFPRFRNGRWRGIILFSGLSAPGLTKTQRDRRERVANPRDDVMGRTSTSAPLAAASTGNPILGTAPIKRALLQYAFVALLVTAVWHNVLPHLSVKALIPAVVLESHAARLGLQAMTVSFALCLALLPFLMCPRLPPKPTEGTAWTNDPAFLARIGVVIPCHKSADEIGDVLKQALKYFKPEHIVVADNANAPLPPDKTAAVVAGTNKLIKYLYIPHGHKTRALVHGSLELPAECEFVLHLDDDTMLSDSMVFDETKFSDDPAVSGVTFGIRMAGDSLVSRCVRRAQPAARTRAHSCLTRTKLRAFATQLRGLGVHPVLHLPHLHGRALDGVLLPRHHRAGERTHRATRLPAAHLCHVPPLPPHAAPDSPCCPCTRPSRRAPRCDLQWRRERWMRILETHAAMPYGEDAWVGSDAISNDERIAAELRCWVRTYAPSRLLPVIGCCGTGAREQGYGASSIWKQRAQRWYTNAPRRLLLRLSQFVHYQAGGLSRNLWFRAFMLFHMVQVANNVLAPVYIAHTALGSPTAALQTVRYLVLVLGAFRYFKSCVVAAFVSWRDPALRASALTLVAYPFYLLFLDVCFVYGHWYSLLYYTPFFPLRRHAPREWIRAHADVAAGVHASALEDGSSAHSSSSRSSLSELSFHPPNKPMGKLRAPRPSAEAPTLSAPAPTDATLELKAAPANDKENSTAFKGITVERTPSAAA